MKEEQIKIFLEEIFKIMPNYKQKVMNPPIFDGKKLSFLQHISIVILNDHEPLTLNQLSELNNVTKQQMSKVVETLTNLELVKREIDPNNRRQILLSLSEKGKDFIKKIRKEHFEVLKSTLGKYSEEELTSINQHIKAIGEILSSK